MGRDEGVMLCVWVLGGGARVGRVEGVIVGRGEG